MACRGIKEKREKRRQEEKEKDRERGGERDRYREIMEASVLDKERQIAIEKILCRQNEIDLNVIPDSPYHPLVS